MPVLANWMNKNSRYITKIRTAKIYDNKKHEKSKVKNVILERQNVKNQKYWKIKKYIKWLSISRYRKHEKQKTANVTGRQKKYI